MTETEIVAIEDWLATQGLEGSSQPELVMGFAKRLETSGVAVRRFVAGSDLLHPTIGGRGHRWERGRGVELNEYSREAARMDDNPDWVTSPWHLMMNEGRSELRRRLTADYVRGEFPLLDALQEAGSTDYLAYVVPYGSIRALGDMEGLVASITTDDPGGFEAGMVVVLRRLIRRFALAYKMINTLQTTQILMRTYLGSDAADRVLSGSIGRGASEMIHAAVWYSDLEGFTRLADTLSKEALILFLDAYAECFVEAIHGHGGQVLKFVGDGILAIFPLDGPKRVGAGAALAAAVAAQKGSLRLFHERAAKDQPVSRCFIGLHVGEVLYGNVGSADRLDFTVLGPAVNEVARIERLCRSLEQAIIVSEAFCGALEAPERERIVSLGRYALRGVGRAQELFTLDPAKALDVV